MIYYLSVPTLEFSLPIVTLILPYQYWVKLWHMSYPAPAGNPLGSQQATYSPIFAVGIVGTDNALPKLPKSLSGGRKMC